MEKRTPEARLSASAERTICSIEGAAMREGSEERGQERQGLNTQKRRLTFAALKISTKSVDSQSWPGKFPKEAGARASVRRKTPRLKQPSKGRDRRPIKIRLEIEWAGMQSLASIRAQNRN